MPKAKNKLKTKNVGDLSCAIREKSDERKNLLTMRVVERVHFCARPTMEKGSQ